MEVIPGLHLVPGIGPFVNVYLWDPRRLKDEDAGGVPILFDCGLPWTGRGLVAGLVALGCPPEALGAIAITHDDIDHVGRLAELSSVTRAEVVAHRLEAERIANGSWRLPPRNREGPAAVFRAFSSLNRLVPRHPGRVTHPLEDGQTLLGGWVAIHTPGHTPGHTSYYHPRHSVMIVGDAIGGGPGKFLRFPMAIYDEDPAAAARSIKKIAALRPSILCFGHGPVMYGAAETLQQFADSLDDGK